MTRALVLSGGGARGAYQAGVLQGMRDLGLLGGPDGFEVLVGASAGAINAALLAAHAPSFGDAVERLVGIWSGLEAQRVFRTDLRSLGGIGVKWMRDLSLGGAFRRVVPKSLLDTAPLRELLLEHIPFEAIHRNVDAGHLRAFALPVTDLYTADGVIFLDAAEDVPLWERGRWSIERARIGVEHVMASSAIPVFFPSVEIEGRHFGDGSVRNTAPLSPAINLGADRILAIGVRRASSQTGRVLHPHPPSIAQVAAALLDSVMLDAIGIDVEHSERVNQGVIATPRDHEGHSFRRIEVLWISPTRHFQDVAREFSDRIPATVRYLMRGLGTDDETTELASFLLFDGGFCQRLIEIGREDVQARGDEVRDFMARGAVPAPGPTGEERTA